MQQDRNQPLTARSVIASLLLGSDPPALPSMALVRAAAALGAGEGATRVALSRMAAAGEVVAVDGRYELAGAALLDRRARQDEGRHPALRPWDGTWRVAVAGDGSRRPAGERADLRRRLAGRRLAEWREGVWLRPDNLPDQGPLDGCLWFAGARPDASPGTLSTLWDLAWWVEHAAALVDAMEGVLPLMAVEPDRLREGFGLAARVVRHLRDDPLLPVELLPPAWPGPALRDAYERFERAFRDALLPILVGR